MFISGNSLLYLEMFSIGITPANPEKLLNKAFQSSFSFKFPP
ncbi:hypothetical protein ES708_21558 [subsurface metagenome]